MVEYGILNPMTFKNKQEYNNYMKSYMREKYHKRMSDAKNLFGNSCYICDSSDSLEFDHIDPDTKTFTIGKMWSASESKFLEELSKCQLLCKKCHVEKHKSQKECGTPQKYWLGCRCFSCTNANSIHSKNYKKSRLSGANG